MTFVDTTMSEVVRPEGWHNWEKPEREQTSRFAEFGSKGQGGNPEARVGWARQITPQEAAALTPVTVLGGADGWNPGDVPAHPSGKRVSELPVPAAPGGSQPQQPRQPQ